MKTKERLSSLGDVGISRQTLFCLRNSINTGDLFLSFLSRAKTIVIILHENISNEGWIQLVTKIEGFVESDLLIQRATKA